MLGFVSPGYAGLNGAGALIGKGDLAPPARCWLIEEAPEGVRRESGVALADRRRPEGV